MGVKPTDIGKYIAELDIQDRILDMRKRDWVTWHNNKTTKAFIDFLIDRRLHIQTDIAHIPNITVEKYSELRGGYKEIGYLYDILMELLHPEQEEEQPEGE